MDGNGRWAGERGLPRAEAIARAWRACGARAGRARARHHPSDSVQLLVGELVAAEAGDQRPVRPAAPLHPPRSRRAAPERRQDQRSSARATASTPTSCALIDEAEALTADNTALNLTIAFNYGARDEIARAARRIAEAVAEGALDAGRRHAGELRRLSRHGRHARSRSADPHQRRDALSNFLLWQVAYSEFVFVDAYWPDFSREQLEAAIAEYQRRNRRFGGTSARSTA